MDSYIVKQIYNTILTQVTNSNKDPYEKNLKFAMAKDLNFSMVGCQAQHPKLGLLPLVCMRIEDDTEPKICNGKDSLSKISKSYGHHCIYCQWPYCKK